MSLSNFFNKLSRGEICVANFRPPCDCCLFGELYIYMTPILIFQSLSSFNTNLREINFYEKHCQFIVWGPKLQAVWRKRGSANRPKMDQFENFSIIYCTKSKFKWGPCYKKKSQLMYLGAHFGGRLEK